MIYLLEKLTVCKFLEKTNQISSETYEYTHNFNAIIILTSDLTFYTNNKKSSWGIYTFTS